MCCCILKAAAMPAARVSPANHNNNHLPSIKTLVSSGSSSSECPSLQEPPEEDLKEAPRSTPTPYQKAILKLQNDDRWLKDISLGKRIGLYRLKEELGTGNFSQVKAAVHSVTKERVAVKILDKSKLDKKTQKMLAREISSMESLHHPHVIRIYEVLETLSRIYLVMEHASGGELFHRISQNGQFSEKAARPIFAQITAAVDHMHQHNIVHRDLKAENVFFSGPDSVKVGDFGFSTPIRDLHEPLRTFCGSPPYAAPELFRDDSYAGPPVDVWALGVLLYFMLTASMPFKAQTVAGLKRQILEGEFAIPDFLSSECHFLIKGILRQDPHSRTTLEQVKRSNWLAGHPLPGPLPRDRFAPATSGDCRDCSPADPTPIEIAVRDQLQELGISEEMVAEARSKGSRSSVMGTYRIALHRCLSELDPSLYQDSAQNSAPSQFLRNGSSPKKVKVVKNRKSKTCIIL